MIVTTIDPTINLHCWEILEHAEVVVVGFNIKSLGYFIKLQENDEQVNQFSH